MKGFAGFHFRDLLVTQEWSSGHNKSSEAPKPGHCGCLRCPAHRKVTIWASHVRTLWGLKHAVENVTLYVTAIILHPLHLYRRFSIHETSLSVRNIFGSNVFICWLRAIGRRAEDIYDDNKMPVIAGHEIELTSNYINIYGFFVRFLLDRSLCRANITGRHHHHRSPREPLAVNE